MDNTLTQAPEKEKLFEMAEIELGNTAHNLVSELTKPCWAAISEPGLRERRAFIHNALEKEDIANCRCTHIL